MGNLLGSVGADAAASGTLASAAAPLAEQAGWAGLLDQIGQANQLFGGGGGMQQGAGLLGNVNAGGPRQLSPLGALVPPVLGQTTFPQLGQTSIMQVLQQLLGQPTGQFK